MEGKALYCVSADAVNRLKSLADNGNVERWVPISCPGPPCSISYLCRFLAEAAGSRSRKSSSSSSYTSVHSTISSSRTILTANDQMPLTSPLIEGGVITPLFSAASTNPSSTTFRFRVKEGVQAKHETRQSQRVGPIPTSQQGSIHQPHYQLYPKKQSPAHSADAKSTTMSVLTTSSEIDFRNNLATLDADIARLQMQFKVARQSSSQ